MSTNSKSVRAIKLDGTVNTDTGSRRHADYKKSTGVLGRIKDLIGKVLIVDEDWIFKSDEWPYMWKKK